MHKNKKVVLLLIAMFSLPISVSAIFMSYFWYAATNNSGDYVETIFEVKEIALVKYGSKQRYEVALGRVNGTEEILYSWRDYFKTKPKALEASGQRLPVMYNSKASHFHYSGRNLRVLSITQYNHATNRLYQSIATSALSPMLWLVYFLYCKRMGAGQST